MPAAKRERTARISVVIPACNEAATIGGIVAKIRHELVEPVPLIDELVVTDSHSDDTTTQVATAAGATTWHVAESVRTRDGSGQG